MEAALRDAWRDLAAGLGISSAEAAAGLDDLAARYAEPHRAFHTLAHVAAVLATVTSLADAGEPVADLAAVRLAAWYHDAVYDPRASSNEARSADLATGELAGWGVDAERVRRVRRLILATRDHVARDADSAVLVDADLAVLAGPPPAYRSYIDAVRAEYGWLPDPEWRAGRATFLGGLLDRDGIFATPTMRYRAESAARRNLRRELEELDAAIA